MKFKWEIEKLNRRKSSGYVYSADVRVSVDDGIGNNFTTLTCSWPNGELEIPYDQLTQDEVLEWVYQSVNKEAIEEGLTLQLTETEVHISGLPW